MKRIPAAPGRAVDFARSPPAGAFVGFVYYSALFPGRRLFPPVEQHSQHAAAGSQHQADPQRHIAAVPGLGAAGSRFCRPGGFFPCAYAISSLYRTGAPCEESGAPHAPQKRLPGGISAPHWGICFPASPRSCCRIWRRPHTGFCRRGKPPYPRSVPPRRFAPPPSGRRRRCTAQSPGKSLTAAFSACRRPHRQSPPAAMR